MVRGGRPVWGVASAAAADPAEAEGEKAEAVKLLSLKPRNTEAPYFYRLEKTGRLP